MIFNIFINLLKIIFIFLFSLFLFNNAQSFTDIDGKGAQSSGREDLSFLNVKNSNFKKGKDTFKKALKLERKKKIDKANKKFEKALKYFIAAYKEYPDNIEIVKHLAFVYYKINDFMMAEIYYVEALSIDPNSILINKRLGDLYIKTKREELAKERLEILKPCNCEEYIELKKIIDKN